VNGPDRRRSPDGMDDDAIFADIVAHLNDDVPEPERTARPVAADAATDHRTSNHQRTDHQRTDETPERESADHQTPDENSEHESADHQTPDEQPEHESADETSDQPSGDVDGDPQLLPTPQVWRAHEVDDEHEDHFEPPPVTPLPAGDLQFWAIIAGMVGGPLLLLYLVFFNRDANGYWILTAIAMSVGGFALLVSRMPGHHEEDDDGARL
jgi:hypothetical protein